MMPMIYKMKNAPLNLQTTFIDTLFDPFKYLLSVKCFVHDALLAKRLTAESGRQNLSNVNVVNVNPGKPENKVACWDFRESSSRSAARVALFTATLG